MTPYLSLVLPAYQEAERLPGTLVDIQRVLEGVNYEVVVVARGDDGAAEGADRLGPPVRVLRVEFPGKGFAVRCGVEVAEGSIIGFMDADGKVSASEIRKIWAPLARGAQVVIGSRRVPGAQIEQPQPFTRRIGSHVFGAIIRSVTGLHDIPDTQCGFKFFRRAEARCLFSRQRVDGYMFDVEVLVLARRAGYRIEQVPVRWRDDGNSRFRLVSGTARNLVDLLRIRRIAA